MLLDMPKENPLEKAFLEAVTAVPPNFARARALLAEGCDINSVDSYGRTLLARAFFYALGDCSMSQDSCNGICHTCSNKERGRILPIIDFFIENGWDTLGQGLSCLAALVHTTHDAEMFFSARRILSCHLPDDDGKYDVALKAIGTEESYQRCSEECHSQENLYYAMYELVAARRAGKSFEGIFPYYRALGRRIERIVFFSDSVEISTTSRGSEFSADIGFVCGGELLVLTSGINVLVMNDRLNEAPQIDASHIFGDGVIGATVVNIDFDHRAITKDRTTYGQPTIEITLDNGKKLCFTHNFGEVLGGKTEPRFYTQEGTSGIRSRIEYLYPLCAARYIDLDVVEGYIVGAALSGEELTRFAIELVVWRWAELDAFLGDGGNWSDGDGRVSSNWLGLFSLLLRYGLDPNAVFCEDGAHNNLLFHLWSLDNRGVMYKLYRLLFENGADPNVMLDDETFFEEIDGDVVTLATLLEIEAEDREVYERTFRVWLLSLAYGGRLKEIHPLTMREGYDFGIFVNCEDFSYRLERKKKDWFLHILFTKTGEEVAVL